MPPAKRTTTRKSAAKKPVPKKKAVAKKPAAKAKPKVKMAVKKTDEPPKFGTPEWREKYMKKKKRK